VYKVIYTWFYNPFSINPIRDITLITGKAALIFLVITLSASPINFLFGFNKMLKIRPFLGVYSFLFALAHFSIFIVIDYVLDPNLIFSAVLDQPFALVGFIAFSIMLPLAITSTNAWKKKLRKNWKKIHTLIYIIPGFVIVHYFWLSKDKISPLIYSSILVALLILRIPKIKQLIKS
jgi:methionine sulfoxide reductase heme-binding subunit